MPETSFLNPKVPLSEEIAEATERQNLEYGVFFRSLLEMHHLVVVGRFHCRGDATKYAQRLAAELNESFTRPCEYGWKLIGKSSIVFPATNGKKN